jgi:hypothetical protein
MITMLVLQQHATNLEVTSYAVSYTVSDEISLTYGTEESESGASTVDAEFTGLQLLTLLVE